MRETKLVAKLDIDNQPMKEKLNEIENQLDRILTKLEKVKSECTCMQSDQEFSSRNEQRVRGERK